MHGTLDARMTRGALIAAALASAATIARLVGFTGGPSACPFALITGHACPLCGSTRAAVAVLRGDLASAFALHPAVVGLAPLAAWFAWRWIDGRSDAVSPSAKRKMGWAVLLGLTAIWMIRLATGALPPV